MSIKIPLGRKVDHSAAIGLVDLEAARPTFDRIAFLVQCFAGTQIARIGIIEANQVWLTGVANTSSPLPSEHAFIAQVITGEKVLWIEDATRDPRFCDDPLVGGEAAIRFYAGAPVRLSDGTRVGAVSIMDHKPRAFDAFLAARLEDFAVFVADEWDRRQALNDLRRTTAEASVVKRRLEALIASAPVALVMTDREFRILQVNPRWMTERGLEGVDVLGRRLMDLLPESHERRAEGFEAALRGETYSWDKLQLVLPNGRRPWVRSEAAPWRDASGVIGGLLIKSHDITDMVEAVEAAERSERRLRLATQMAELRVWEADLSSGERHPKSVGAALSYLDGFEGTGDLRRDLWAVVHPADRPAAQALWEKYLADGTPFRTSYRMTRPDGSHVWVASTAEAVRGEDGRVERIVGVLKDVDREKRAEQAMAKALAAAQTANRAKSEFLANMSHEIRTPLNGVMGIASVLGRTTLTPAQREMVELVGASAHTLEALLSDVLDLARIESGRMELRDEPFDLAESLNAVARLFEAKARDKGLVFRITISPAAKILVRGDAIRVRQIVSNLVSNAIKFTDAGKVSLHVEAEQFVKRVRMRLSVVDTGIGFDADVGQRLFQRFEQADGSVTRRFGGTGLGLAISKSLADAMGGSLEATSTLGKGAVFTLELDLLRAQGDVAASVASRDPVDVATEAPAQVKPVATEAGTPPEPALRVLLAEDHPINRKVVSLILEAIGAELTSVVNGAEAVEAAGRDEFDLILMDVQMPVMDGLTAIRMIRRREHGEGRSRTPILALTANAMADDALASEAAGADGHLTKPIGAERLITAIRQARRASPTDASNPKRVAEV